MERCSHLAAPCIIASLRGDTPKEERLAFRRFCGQSRNQLEDSITSRPESLPRRQTGLPDLAGRMGSDDRRNDNVPGARVPPASRLCREAGNGEIVIGDKTEKQLSPPAAAQRARSDPSLKGFSEVITAWRRLPLPITAASPHFSYPSSRDSARTRSRSRSESERSADRRNKVKSSGDRRLAESPEGCPGHQRAGRISRRAVPAERFPPSGSRRAVPAELHENILSKGNPGRNEAGAGRSSRSEVETACSQSSPQGAEGGNSQQKGMRNAG